MDQLSNDELSRVISTVIGACDEEILRYIDEKKRLIITEKLQTIYNTNNQYYFFTDQALLNFSKDLFSDEIFRDFILNLSEKISLVIFVDNLTIDRLAEHVSNAVCIYKYKSSDTLTLIPTSLIDSIYLDVNNINITLKHNIWLIVIYFIKLFFNQSEIFKSLNK